jgi:hypothetical protein
MKNNPQYIEAPNREPISYPHSSIFLAGSISNAWDWQKLATNCLASVGEITIVNPRRKNFDIVNPNESKSQICWEFDYLREVSHILFWFSQETVGPITLFELGATLERNKWSFDEGYDEQTIFIGCDPLYSRLFDVEIQSSLIGYKLPVFKNLQMMLDFIKLGLTGNQKTVG